MGNMLTCEMYATGIDHLLALECFQDIHTGGGKVESFISFCGGESGYIPSDQRSMPLEILILYCSYNIYKVGQLKKIKENRTQKCHFDIFSACFGH